MQDLTMKPLKHLLQLGQGTITKFVYKLPGSFLALQTNAETIFEDGFQIYASNIGVETLRMVQYSTRYRNEGSLL